MDDNNATSVETPAPALEVAPSPHLFSTVLTTRRMMLQVLVALLPVMAAACWVFGWYAVKQVGLCVLACMAAEYCFQISYEESSQAFCSMCMVWASQACFSPERRAL